MQPHMAFVQEQINYRTGIHYASSLVRMHVGRTLLAWLTTQITQTGLVVHCTIFDSILQLAAEKKESKMVQLENFSALLIF